MDDAGVRDDDDGGEESGGEDRERVREGEGRGRRWARERRGAGGRLPTIFSVNDVYELENLGRLREFIRAHTNDMRDPFVCTLTGIFIAVVVEFVRFGRRACR